MNDRAIPDARRRELRIQWRRLFGQALKGVLPRAAALVRGYSWFDCGIKDRLPRIPGETARQRIQRAFDAGLIVPNAALHDARALRDRISHNALIPTLHESLDALDCLCGAHYRIETRRRLTARWWEAKLSQRIGTLLPTETGSFQFTHSAQSLKILHDAEKSGDRTVTCAAFVVAMALAESALERLAGSTLTGEDYQQFRTLAFFEQLMRGAGSRTGWLPPALVTEGLRTACSSRNDFAHEARTGIGAEQLETLLRVLEALSSTVARTAVVQSAMPALDATTESPPPDREDFQSVLADLTSYERRVFVSWATSTLTPNRQAQLQARKASIRNAAVIRGAIEVALTTLGVDSAAKIISEVWKCAAVDSPSGRAWNAAWFRASDAMFNHLMFTLPEPSVIDQLRETGSAFLHGRLDQDPFMRLLEAWSSSNVSDRQELVEMETRAFANRRKL